MAITLFVVTTSEFQVAAMLTDMASDLHVATATLGMLVTVYALGMGLGGPAVAWLLRRLPAKRGLVLVLGVYAVTEAVAGGVGSTGPLFVLRAVTGALSGAAFGMSLSIGMRLGSRLEQTRTSAAILTGLMVGTLLGLPLSHLVGTFFGWRVSFYVLGGGAAIMAAAVMVTVPALGPDETVTEDGRHALRGRALWIRYGASFLTIGGAFAVFAFIDPVLRRSGLSEVSSTWVMLGFGVAALTVNRFAGRVTPGSARRWLLAGLATQLVALVFCLAGPDHVAIVALATILLGGTGIALNPLLVDRVLAVAQPTMLVNTFHTSAITLGIAAATAIGSRSYYRSGDLSATLWVGVAFTVAALALTCRTPERAAGVNRDTVPAAPLRGAGPSSSCRS
ncbi:MFS transporter [Prescottella agglutinans]|uniref:MFS transporter n=1 Tax=Prescottella agglutinans TaxID=1644129 RepID=UPI003D9653E6